MSRTSAGARMLRRHHLLSTALIGSLLCAMPAVASTDGSSVETVVVTGSRIPQQGLYSSSPVTAVGQQELKLSGTTSVENLLNTLPSIYGDQAGGVSNSATGTATVNLRNLGADRTLVLIDGKRLMAGDPTPSGSETAAADLNNIPVALVDHVEVLTGGASATYGSDAVAGVINFIMRNDFEGVELDGQYGFAQHDNGGNAIANKMLNGAGFPLKRPQSSYVDGQDTSANLILGVNSENGKGNLTMYAGYRNIQPVVQGTRDFSACAAASNVLFGLPGSPADFTCLGSSNAQYGFLMSQDPANPNYGDAYRATAGGNPISYLGTRDAYNFAPLNYLQRPDERYTLGAMGHYDLNSHVQVYTSAMMMDDHTVAQIAPSGWFRGTAPFAGDMHINCDNPFLGSGAGSWHDILCSGLAPAADANVQIGRRLVENGNRQDNLRHTDYRIVVGAKGDLAGSWSYDLSAQYGTSIYSEEFVNDASMTREQNSLEVVDVGGVPTCKAVLAGTDASCVPFNIFDLNGPTAAALNYVKGSGFKEGSTQEWVASASVVGDLGTWGLKSPWAARPVSVALGAEYRQEALDLRTDTSFSTGDLAGQGGPSPSVGGRFNVSEGFAEIQVPLVQEHPYAEDLSLNAGYRYSSYSTAGNVTSYKYGIEWQPIDDLRVRAGFNRAVRAPNVIELFSQSAIGLWSGSDPCGPNPKFSQAQCNNTYGGAVLTNYGTSTLDCPAGQCSDLYGGNPILKPETADTRTLGVVFTPTSVPGLTATVDYFDIKVDGLIGTIPQLDVLNGCALTGNPLFCGLIHRAAGSGILYGSAGYVSALNTNTGFLQTKGVDIEANYTAALEDWGMGDEGSLSFNLVGTYTGSYREEPVPAGLVKAAGLAGPYAYDCAGLYGAVCGAPTPAWRHKLRVTWSTPWDVDLSVAWRHMSGVKLDANTTNSLLNGLCGGVCGDAADAKIDAYDYFDLAANWAVREDVELRAGVTNLFDTDPPILDGLDVAGPPLGNGNTYPTVYDSLGRVFFVGVTLKG